MITMMKDGWRIVKTVWHHDPCIEPGDKDLVFIPVRTGELNVYSVTWEDGSKHQRAYKDCIDGRITTTNKNVCIWIIE